MSTAVTETMPDTVARARLAVFGLVGVYAVQTVLAFAASDALVDYWAERHNYTGEFAQMADDAAPAYGPVALVSLVVVGGLLVLCALSFAKRAAWARVVAMVFGVLALLGGLVAIIQDSPVWYRIIVIIGGLLGLAITVLLASGSSGRWFSRKAAVA